MDGRGGGQGQACASCKYQRRRCNPECPLAPFFPPNQQRQFANAHKVFGVSNILKLLRRLEPRWRLDAIKTVVFQANMRCRDPVRGCTGLIEDLKKHTDWTRAELDITLGQPQTIKQQVQVLGSGRPGLALGTQHFHQYGSSPLTQPPAYGSTSATPAAGDSQLPPGLGSEPRPGGNMIFMGGSVSIDPAQMQGVGGSFDSRPSSMNVGSEAGRRDDFRVFPDILVDHEQTVMPQEQPEFRFPDKMKISIKKEKELLALDSLKALRPTTTRRLKTSPCTDNSRQEN